MLKTTTDETTETTGYRAEKADTAAARTPEPEMSAARRSDRPDALSNTPPLTADLSAEEDQIRPEELAAALANIERRKREVYTGTLPLSETLQKLQTDISPTEVWQEVQTNRAQRATLKTKQKSRAGADSLLIKGAIGLIAVVATGIAVNSYLKQSESDQQLNALRTAKGTGIGQSTQVTPIPIDNITSPFLTQFYKKPTMKRLVDIKEGEALSMDLQRAQEIARLTNGDQTYLPAPKDIQDRIFVDTKQIPGGFQVVKLDGKWYIRGWTNALPNADAATTGNAIKLVSFTLFNHPQKSTRKMKTIVPPPIPPGTSPKDIAKNYSPKSIEVDGGPANIPVSVRVDGFSGYSGGGGPMDTHFDISLDKSKLDKHFNDPWKPLPRLPEEDPNFVKVIRINGGRMEIRGNVTTVIRDVPQGGGTGAPSSQVITTISK